MKIRNKKQWYEGDLIPITDSAIQKFDEKDFNEVSSTSEYLPRLQLCGSNSELVKEGKIGMGHFALVVNKNTFTDLGLEVDVLVVNWRPKALEIGDEIISLYDPKSDAFQNIKTRSEVQDSGCMFGPEFLVWIPEIEKFATFYMSSKSARNESPNMRARLRNAAKIKSKYIKTKKYSWHGPEVLDTSESLEVPDLNELKEIETKFMNPPEREVELADEDSDNSERER